MTKSKFLNSIPFFTENEEWFSGTKPRGGLKDRRNASGFFQSSKGIVSNEGKPKTPRSHSHSHLFFFFF